MIKYADNKPAAIYLRRSTDRQEQSLRDQRAVVARWADEHGFTIAVDDYVDDAISGTSATGRPAFLRMIEDAKQPDCAFRHILVYDTKRFSRGGPDEAGYFRHILRRHGVLVHYVADGIVGAGDDILRCTINDYIGHKESVSLSQVTIRGQVSAAENGWWNGGMPPYGYDLEYVSNTGTVLYRVRYLETGEKLMIDPDGRVMRTLPPKVRIPKTKNDKVRLVVSTPERLAVVREIFDMYRRGMGYKPIAEALNERGIPSPKSGNWSKRTHVGWSKSTIRSILVNLIYLGAVVYNRRSGGNVNRISKGQAVERDPVLAAGRDGKKIYTPNSPADHVVARVKHEAIVDHHTMDAAEALRASRQRVCKSDTYRSGRGRSSDHLLSGLIRCHCGHVYGGMITYKGKRRTDGSRVVTRYYICSGYRTKGPIKCRKTLLPAPALEDGIVAHIEQRVVEFMQGGGADVLRVALTSAATAWLERNTPDPRAIEDRRWAIGADIKRLLASITPVNAKYIDEEIVALDREREELEGQLDRLRVWKATAPDVDKIVDEIVACLKDFQAVFDEGTPEEKKEFIRLFVEGIELDAEKRVARCRIKKFPAPSDLDAGKLSFGLVAGVRDEQQKIVFPPVDVVEIPLVARGRVLVPAAAA